jgi:hypothetical protein
MNIRFASTAAALIIATTCGAAAFAATPEAEQAFALAEKLEAAQPWTVDNVGAITGIPLNGRGFATYMSEDHPDYKVVRQVGLVVKSNKGKYWVRDVALRLPDSTNMQLADAIARYGSPSYIDGRRQMFRRGHQWLAVVLDTGTRVRSIELLRRKNVDSIAFGE